VSAPLLLAHGAPPFVEAALVLFALVIAALVALVLGVRWLVRRVRR